MQQSARNLLKSGIGIVLIILVLFYVYVQFNAYLTGPTLTIFEPTHGETLNEELTTIRGHATNISYIRLNGNQIYVDPNGDFEEKLLMAPGYNIIEITVEDRFDRSKSEFLEVVYNPPKQQETQGTSTPIEILPS